MKKKTQKKVLIGIVVLIGIFLIWYFGFRELSIQGNPNPSSPQKDVLSAVPISCTPESGYDYCDSYSNTYGSATAIVKLQMSNVKGTYKSGYYVGPVTLNIKASGNDPFYLTAYQGNNIAPNWDGFWNVIDCDGTGCFGNTIQTPIMITFANPGEEYHGCPVYYAWNRFDASNGDWAYVQTARGWVGDTNDCVNIKSVNCYDDSDCETGKTCDKSGDWTTWSCKIKPECPTGQTKCSDGVCRENCNEICEPIVYQGQNAQFCCPSNTFICLITSDYSKSLCGTTQGWCDNYLSWMSNPNNNFCLQTETTVDCCETSGKSVNDCEDCPNGQTKCSDGVCRENCEENPTNGLIWIIGLIIIFIGGLGFLYWKTRKK